MSVSSSLMVRLRNILCLFNNTGVNEAWPPKDKDTETERFSKARVLVYITTLKHTTLWA